MIPGFHSYEERRRAFRWHIPETFNAAIDSIDRHCKPGADPDRTALIVPRPDGSAGYYSYGELKRLSDKLASALVALMVEPGTSVCSLLPSGLETSLTALGTLKAGGVIASLNRDWTTAQQIRATQVIEPRVLIADRPTLSRARMIAQSCTPAPTILCVDAPMGDIADFWETLESAPDTPIHVTTKPDDPAVIVFSQGRTGTPKALVHAHRSVLGHLPAVEMVFEDIPRTGDVLWSAAAPSHPSGILTGILGAWMLGTPIVAMDPPSTSAEVERCFGAIAHHGVRLILMTPAALQHFCLYPEPRVLFNFLLRGVACIGGRPPEDAHAWCESALGLPLGKLYGEAETGPIAASHPHWFPTESSTDLGRAAPGINVNILDKDGLSIPLNGIGHMVVPQNHPGLCLSHLGTIRETSRWARRKYVGNWFLTDDLATVDEDNGLTFISKVDDLIPYGDSGFLPDDIETVLSRHHMVIRAAVTSAPSQHRGHPRHIIAIICPSDPAVLGDHAAEAMLAKDIISHAAKSLASYAVPDHVLFVNTVPTTDEDRVSRAALRALLEQHAPLPVTAE